MKAVIIGREKNLAYAELEACFGQIQIENQAVLIDTKTITINNLGSVQKTTTEIQPLESLTEHDIARYIINTVSTSTKPVLSLSMYLKRNPHVHSYKKLVFAIKKILKSHNMNARFILPKKDCALSSAQSFNYQKKNYFELIIVNNKSGYAIGLLAQVQDIESYSRRDYERPCRDAKVGMLPPKLAQIMINLSRPTTLATIYDPFCGSGVVLQEALLMGYDVSGSDISQKLVDCTHKNIQWLKQSYTVNKDYTLMQADATAISPRFSDYAVVTEGYLGKPLSVSPDNALLTTLQTELHALYSSFLQRLTEVTHKPKIVVVCTPIWRDKNNSLQSLKTLDHIDSLGYTKVQFQSVRNQKLVYMRSQQIVGREITVLIPK